MSISGKWQHLADYLTKKSEETIVLTDEEIQQIVGSSDNTRPYNIDFLSDPEYSIRQRAADAGYDVKCHKLNGRVKIFDKKQK
ncbi:MAG: hypothetical protein ABSG71_06170 [Thermodesulfobacteriota bacterium]|jgi:hypothetical protein